MKGESGSSDTTTETKDRDGAVPQSRNLHPEDGNDMVTDRVSSTSYF